MNLRPAPSRRAQDCRPAPRVLQIDQPLYRSDRRRRRAARRRRRRGRGRRGGRRLAGGAEHVVHRQVTGLLTARADLDLGARRRALDGRGCGRRGGGCGGRGRRGGRPEHIAHRQVGVRGRRRGAACASAAGHGLAGDRLGIDNSWPYIFTRRGRSALRPDDERMDQYCSGPNHAPESTLASGSDARTDRRAPGS